MPNLYVIAGCNGAGKTTASYTILPEILNCKARIKGYSVAMLFFWLNSFDLAKQRVSERVKQGGHNIPEDVIERRYQRGIHNLKKFIPVCDYWIVLDNTSGKSMTIAEGNREVVNSVYNTDIWEKIQAT